MEKAESDAAGTQQQQLGCGFAVVGCKWWWWWQMWKFKERLLMPHTAAAPSLLTQKRRLPQYCDEMGKKSQSFCCVYLLQTRMPLATIEMRNWLWTRLIPRHLSAFFCQLPKREPQPSFLYGGRSHFSFLLTLSLPPCLYHTLMCQYEFKSRFHFAVTAALSIFLQQHPLQQCKANPERKDKGFALT